MSKIEIKNNTLFCPAASLDISFENCKKCRYKKDISTEYIDCTYDELSFSDKWK